MNSRTVSMIPMLAPGQYLGGVLTEFGPALVLDIREYQRSPTKQEPDRMAPGVRWIAVDATRLPALRAMLEKAEAEAIAKGAVSPADYTEHGLPVPAALSMRVAR